MMGGGFSQSDSSTNIRDTKGGDVKQGDIKMPSAMEIASGHGSRGITLNFGEGSGTQKDLSSATGGKMNWLLIGGAGLAAVVVLWFLLRRH